MNLVESGRMIRELKFATLSANSPENTLLKDLLKELLDATNENEQKTHIKEFLEIYRTSLDENTKRGAKNVVLELFTTFSSKKVLKKYLQILIGKHHLTTEFIKTTADEILDQIKDKGICFVKPSIHLMNFVVTMQNFGTFDYEKNTECLFPFYLTIFEGFVYNLKYNVSTTSPIREEVCTFLNLILKQILSIFVKNIPYLKVVVNDYSVNLAVLSHAVISSEYIGFDLKTKSGLILTHSFMIVPTIHRNHFKYKDCPALDLLKDFNNEDYLNLADSQLSVLESNDAAVILFSSMLSAIPEEKLLEINIDKKILLCLLYDGLIDYAKRMTNITYAIVEISRTFSHIGRLLKLVPIELVDPLFSAGMSFVLSHIEHFVDTVRNYTRLFFIELVAVATYHYTNGYYDVVEILVDNIKNLGHRQSLRYLGWENMAIHLGCDFLMETFEDLPDSLLTSIMESSISDQVCRTYITIMERHFKDLETEDWITIWVAPITDVLRSYAQSGPVCQKILTRAFQLYPAVLRVIFPNDYVGNTQECAVLLKCLQYARNHGVEVSTKEHNVYWRGLIDKEKMTKFMIHQDDEVRVLALASIVESQKTTEIYLDWELNYLTSYLHYNVTSQSPNIRKQILTYYKKSLTRFNAGYHVVIRNIGQLTKDLDTVGDRRETVAILRVFTEIRNSYKHFLRRITRQLVSYLTFDSSFYRRSTSLELLILLHKMLTKDEWLACWTEEDVKNCHSLLFDGYESNKKMAVILLRNLPSNYIGFTSVEFTFKYMQRCFSIALAIKPSKSLAAAYLMEVCAFSPHFYDIVQSGESDLDIRRGHSPILDMLVVLTSKLIAQSTVTAESDSPKVANYGLILSIRYMLRDRDLSKNNEAYSELFGHLARVCLSLKESVMPIVCNPSPEGYLSDSSNDNICDSDYCPKSQLIVVCAWRTIKEITLLLAEMISQAIKLENTIEMIKESVIIEICEFFNNIFIECKHRGVFEQAYIGFSVICESFWLSSNPTLNSLPYIWLQDALALCIGEKHSDKLSATRRSAGLPFLILSILSSEPSINKHRFQETMTTLLTACKDISPQDTEHKIHCMNVLRAIYRHSKLGEMVSPFVGNGVIIAISGFNSETWGIRNSATLLYSALMTRMFGVQRTQDSEDLCLKNRMTVRVFFMRYPELFQFLSDTLAAECTNADSLLLHPVLMILARLYPSPMEEYNGQLGKYLPYLKTCFSNPVYRTRELAARASVAFIQSEQILSCFDNTFSCLKKADLKDNECHGLLLQVSHILKNNNLPDIPVSNYLQNSIHLLHYVGRKFSHMTVTLYIEVVTVLLIKYHNYDNVQILKTIVTILSRQIASGIVPITSLGKYPQARFLLLLLIVINKFEENDSTYPTLTNQIMCQLYGHNREMKRFCFHLLIYMNQILSEPESQHSLYLTGEMEIPSEIITVVDTFEKASITKLLKNIHQYLKCFLIEEIKYRHYIKKEDLVLLFILVNYYPCVVRYLYLSKQSTLNTLLGYCDSDNEELISAVISCISTFLLQLDYNVLNYNDLVDHLAQSASPAVSEYRRLAVCDFLVKNYILYCNEEPILHGDALSMVLSIVMVLLEDDELQVRNAMSDFATTLKIRIILNNRPRNTISGQKLPVIPEKAREDLINLGSLVLDKQQAICFLFSWACRHFPDPVSDGNEHALFDQSELNQYAENVPFVDLCSKLLHNHLWPLEDGLNYEDKSIFIEEHTLLVTTLLLDSIEKNSSPMMVYRTKLSVICALKSTIKFVERFPINTNFVLEFKKYMNEKIIGYLTRHVEHPDIFSVKKILRNVYGPILNYRIRRI